MRRYALRDDQWDRIKDFLPGREGHVGVWLRCTIVDRAALITPLMTPRMMLNIANFLASAATDEGVSRDASMSEVK